MSAAVESTEVNRCKKCGAPVRYATLQTGKTERGAAFEAEMVPGGGYELSEQEVDGVATGRWVASYIKVADRQFGRKRRYRTHDCQPVPHFDSRDFAPVLIGGVWQLIHKGNMKAVK